MNPPKSHPKTTATVILILILITITVALITGVEGFYTPLRWVLSAGLIYCSGYFLQPRRKALIQDPNNTTSDRDRVNLNDVQKYRFPGWFEFDRFDKSLVLWEKDKAIPAPVDNAEIAGIADDRRLHYKGHSFSDPLFIEPISINAALALISLGIFFNPVNGIQLPRDSWMYADMLLVIILCIALYTFGSENSSPRKACICFDGEGMPFNLGSTCRTPDQHWLADNWKSGIIFLFTITALLLTAMI